ncbi:MAG: glycosyltransferase [Coprobacter sp.]|nr:glycosyltransferase [Coprobacter sp.]
MIQPLFSIITVARNAREALETTLKSVHEQTYTNFEYIIVDGDSQDGTKEFLHRNRTWINQWISEPDNGIYDAMNKGLHLATGEYVLFLNAGDTLYSDETLEQIYRSIGYSRPDIIYGETALVDSNRNFIGMRRLKAPEQLSWKKFRMGMLVCHQAFIAKRSIAPDYDLQYRFSADFDWCIRCMQKAKTFCNSRLILVNYLNEGMTTQNRKASLKERFAIMGNYYGKFSTVTLHIWFAFRFIFARIFGKNA